jgi:hypothetical protein
MLRSIFPIRSWIALLSFAALVCALCPALAHAGPCAEDLYKADVDVGKRLEEIAASGKTGTESTFATAHHQPTPATVAGAEEKVGDISEAQVTAVRKYMAEAKQADDAGEKDACEKALSEARNLLGM